MAAMHNWVKEEKRKNALTALKNSGCYVSLRRRKKICIKGQIWLICILEKEEQGELVAPIKIDAMGP